MLILDKRCLVLFWKNICISKIKTNRFSSLTSAATWRRRLPIISEGSLEKKNWRRPGFEARFPRPCSYLIVIWCLRDEQVDREWFLEPELQRVVGLGAFLEPAACLRCHWLANHDDGLEADDVALLELGVVAESQVDKVLEDQLAVVLEASGKSHVGYPVCESTNLVPGKAIVEE